MFFTKQWFYGTTDSQNLNETEEQVHQSVKCLPTREDTSDDPMHTVVSTAKGKKQGKKMKTRKVSGSRWIKKNVFLSVIYLYGCLNSCGVYLSTITLMSTNSTNPVL